MCSRFHSSVVASTLVLLFGGAIDAGAAGVLRVCADPNNLPFSNQHEEGFENRMAQILARDLDSKLEWVWWSERKSLVKNTLDSGRCDVLIGVPAGLDSVAVTRPYYRSSYVFVSRPGTEPPLESLDDQRLAGMRIGIHVVGDDYAPPGHALARSGLAANVVPYSLFGEYGEENPPSKLMDAVAKGDVDCAIVWGPFAGFFNQRQRNRLAIRPVKPAMFLAVPFTFEMAVAVRADNTSLRAQLDAALARECASIHTLLKQYGIPLLEPEKAENRCEATSPY